MLPPLLSVDVIYTKFETKEALRLNEAIEL